MPLPSYIQHAPSETSSSRSFPASTLSIVVHTLSVVEGTAFEKRLYTLERSQGILRYTMLLKTPNHGAGSDLGCRETHGARLHGHVQRRPGQPPVPPRFRCRLRGEDGPPCNITHGRVIALSSQARIEMGCAEGGGVGGGGKRGMGEGGRLGACLPWRTV